MKSRFIVSFIVGLGLILLMSTVCYATNIKTKMFYRDLQKCEQFINKQYDLLMEFLNALTKEDVDTLNAGAAKNKDIELFNSKAVSAFKKVKETDRSHPKGVKHSNNHSAGIPRNFLGGYIESVSNYKFIITSYEIPTDDYNEACNKYSGYTINLLDKLQELRSKVDDIGLTIYQLPTINDIFISTGTLTFLTGKNPMYDIGVSFRDHVYNPWRKSVKDIMELYSNKSVLTAQKLWIEFLLNNDLASNKWGDSYTEEYMTELDKIEKRLAKLSGAPVQKQEAAQKPTDVRPESPKPATIQKSKFKLDLPD